eukprot:NODE_843_length_3758_cov_0.336977.p3 type:complete len:124 gc:universal NODE_843_length_3758_cov_0.336977:965-1336(+)
MGVAVGWIITVGVGSLISVPIGSGLFTAGVSAFVSNGIAASVSDGLANLVTNGVSTGELEGGVGDTAVPLNEIIGLLSIRGIATLSIPTPSGIVVPIMLVTRSFGPVNELPVDPEITISAQFV